jgi:hypothetical protein
LGFSGVVALADASGMPFCSGSLIAPAEVLTAAHCFFPPAPELAAIFIGSVPPQAGALVAVEHVWLDPAYEPATRFHDLALLTLAQEVGAETLPVLAEPLPPSALGSDVRVVGFGRATLKVELVKRTGIARIAELTPSSLRLEPAPAAPCSGDSGSPVLLETAEGPFVVGVVSHGDWLCASFAAAALVDRENAPFLLPAAQVGCSAAPRAVHTSASLTFLLLGVLALGRAGVFSGREPQGLSSGSQPRRQRVRREPG